MTHSTPAKSSSSNAAMMPPEAFDRPLAQRVTLLLSLMLLATAILVGYAALRLGQTQDAAISALRDLRVCQANLADLAIWRAGRTTGAPLNAQDPELNRRLSAAALAAGISTELASIEPGSPVRVKDADYTQTPVFVRFGAVSLRELAIFLKDLSAADAAVKPKSIELQPPESPAQRPGEMWTCDLALAYLTYAPRGREGR
jgi:hypothetical protein